jgi:capsule polysaccharide modification protein KpsS
MTHKKLTDEQVEAFIRALKAGFFWNNGLVGNISYSYRNGKFTSSIQDMREPNDNPYIKTYNEAQFRTHLQKTSFPDFVHKSLAEKLKAY